MEQDYTKDEVIKLLQGKWETFTGQHTTEFIGETMWPFIMELNDYSKIEIKWDESLKKWRILYMDPLWNITTIEKLDDTVLQIQYQYKTFPDHNYQSEIFTFRRRQ